MRMWPYLVVLVLVHAGMGQFQPLEPPDWSDHAERDDLAAAGNLAGAVRIARFVQVSDAHIIDDDAPSPLRQEVADFSGSPAQGAQRDHEEFTDETLDAMIQAINALHLSDALDFVINTGDNIDNSLENELMRFIDNWEGTRTTIGPVSGNTCKPDGQSEDVDDDSSDVTDACTSLPDHLAPTGLAAGVPWFTAFGNHDGLVQGNAPVMPGFNTVADDSGRHFLRQSEFVDMHFAAGTSCPNGMTGGSVQDDFGHGFGFAGTRLCDDDLDNDGYYAFGFRGIRFIVLDTMNDDFMAGNENLAGNTTIESVAGNDVFGGYKDGAIDPEQWAWMRSQISGHSDQLVILVSHHTVNSMFGREAEECAADRCLYEALVEAGYKTAPEMIEELAAFDNVVAWIGGHSHRHRIEAKTTDEGGFWNIETSSIVDMPQQARAIELWMAGDKLYLALTPFDHTSPDLRELAAADPNASEAKAGGELDQNVILWLDKPARVQLSPQQSLPRFMILRQVGPQPNDGVHGHVGENVTVTMQANDNLFDTPIAGLEAHVSIRHRDPTNATGVVQIVQDAVMVAGPNGTYSWTFMPDFAGVHFIETTFVDPTRTYPDAGKLSSVLVEGDDPPTKKKKSPAPLGLLAIGLAALRRRR